MVATLDIGTQDCGSVLPAYNLWKHLVRIWLLRWSAFWKGGSGFWGRGLISEGGVCLLGGGGGVSLPRDIKGVKEMRSFHHLFHHKPYSHF